MMHFSFSRNWIYWIRRVNYISVGSSHGDRDTTKNVSPERSPDCKLRIAALPLSITQTITTKPRFESSPQKSPLATAVYVIIICVSIVITAAAAAAATAACGATSNRNLGTVRASQLAPQWERWRLILKVVASVRLGLYNPHLGRVIRQGVTRRVPKTGKLLQHYHRRREQSILIRCQLGRLRFINC